MHRVALGRRRRHHSGPLVGEGVGLGSCQASLTQLSLFHVGALVRQRARVFVFVVVVRRNPVFRVVVAYCSSCGNLSAVRRNFIQSVRHQSAVALIILKFSWWIIARAASLHAAPALVNTSSCSRHSLSSSGAAFRLRSTRRLCRVRSAISSTPLQLQWHISPTAAVHTASAQVVQHFVRRGARKTSFSAEFASNWSPRSFAECCGSPAAASKRGTTYWWCDCPPPRRCSKCSNMSPTYASAHGGSFCPAPGSSEVATVRVSCPSRGRGPRDVAQSRPSFNHHLLGYFLWW